MQKSCSIKSDTNAICNSLRVCKRAASWIERVLTDCTRLKNQAGVCCYCFFSTFKNTEIFD